MRARFCGSAWTGSTTPWPRRRCTAGPWWTSRTSTEAGRDGGPVSGTRPATWSACSRWGRAETPAGPGGRTARGRPVSAPAGQRPGLREGARGAGVAVQRGIPEPRHVDAGGDQRVPALGRGGEVGHGHPGGEPPGGLDLDPRGGEREQARLGDVGDGADVVHGGTVRGRAAAVRRGRGGVTGQARQ